MDSTAIRTALEQFVIDNREFERLEDLLSEVNLFEAIGAVRTELRHSDFLAFLLDPSRNHGLKDIFLKRLIQHALSMARNNQSPVSPVDLDIWDLGDTKVWRERNNIDIFIANDRLKFAVVIENKIGTGEHSQQLERYRNLITQQYPECRIVFMYLTLAGDEPSDPDYIGVSYSTVNGILENIMESRGATLGQDMIVLLRHYTGMLRRNFMEESELILLAKSLYEKHRTALDFIFEHRPDVLSDIHDHLTRRIDSQSELVRDHCSKTLLYFLPKEWGEVAVLNGHSGWTPTERMLLFEFRNESWRLQCALIIGPGNQEMRKQLFEHAISKPSMFKCRSSMGQMWHQIWRKNILSRKDIEEGEMESHVEKIDRFWDQFIRKDMPEIRDEILDFLR